MNADIQNNIKKICLKTIIQVPLIFTFLTLFFFYYVVKVEKHETEKQLNIVVNELVNENPKIKNIVASMDNSTRIGYLSTLNTFDVYQQITNKENDLKIQQENNEVKKKSIKVVGILLLFTLVGILYTIFFTKENLKIELYEATILLLFIAITEYMFLNIVVKNYISVDPTVVKKRFYKNLFQK